MNIISPLTTLRYTPYENAISHIENAKLTLKLAGKKDGEYANVQHLQTAAEIAYNEVLLAIDEYLLRKEGLEYVKAQNIEEYRTRLVKHDKKLIRLLNQAYAHLYICLYYHGIPSSRIMSKGLSVSLKIMEYIND